MKFETIKCINIDQFIIVPINLQKFLISRCLLEVKSPYPESSYFIRLTHFLSGTKHSHHPKETSRRPRPRLQWTEADVKPTKKVKARATTWTNRHTTLNTKAGVQVTNYNKCVHVHFIPIVTFLGGF